MRKIKESSWFGNSGLGSLDGQKATFKGIYWFWIARFSNEKVSKLYRSWIAKSGLGLLLEIKFARY